MMHERKSPPIPRVCSRKAAKTQSREGVLKDRHRDFCYNLPSQTTVMSQLSEQTVLDSLKQIIDPDLRKDIVTLGFIRDLEIDGGDVSFRIVLTTPACPVKEEMEAQATRDRRRRSTASTNVKVTMDAEVPQGRGIANNVAIPGVKNIIAVSSGKGRRRQIDRRGQSRGRTRGRRSEGRHYGRRRLRAERPDDARHRLRPTRGRERPARSRSRHTASR